MHRDSAATSPLVSPTGKYCAQCATPIKRLAQKFCTACGARLDQADTVIQTPSAAARVAAAQVLRNRLDRHRVARTLREGYFQLGLQLMDAGRYRAAAKALDQTSQEEGAVPDTSDALIALGQACEGANEPERAFRAYLEAIAAGFEPVDAAIAHAATLLSPATAQANAGWMLKEWVPKVIGTGAAGEVRARIRSFLGVMLLSLGRDEDALGSFHAAMAADAAIAKDATGTYLSLAILPSSLAAETGEAHFLLARVHRAIGNMPTALTHASRALEIGMDERKEAPVQRVKAELLEDSGDPIQAAKWFYEAGWGYQRRKEYPAAVEVLKRATSLDPNQMLSHWALAETLRLQSYAAADDNARNVQGQLAREALAAWQAGYAIGPPEATQSWVFATRAFIAERLADLGPIESADEARWEAVAWAERALILDPSDGYRWAGLCGLYRGVLKHRCALQAAAKGRKVAPKEPVVLQELCITLTNLGKFDEAERVIDELRQVEPSPWAEFVKARLLLYTGRYDQALAAIITALKEMPEDLLYRSMLALVYRAMGQTERTTETYQSIMEFHKRDGAQTRERFAYFGFAAYGLGEAERAIDFFDESLKIADAASRGTTYRNLALCYLAAGRRGDSRAAFQRGIDAIDQFEEIVLFRMDLDDAERRVPQWPDAAEAAKLLTEVRQETELCAKLLAAPQSPEQELRKFVARLPQMGRTDSWTWVGAHAGLARLCFDAEHFREAAEIYQRLSIQSGRFPDAKIGLARIVDQLQSQGDRNFKEGRPCSARESYAEALRIMEATMAGDLKGQADLHSRIGYAFLESDELEDAHTGFSEALGLYRQAGIFPGSDPLAAVGRSLMRDVTHYWTLDARWKALCESIDSLQGELTPARAALRGYLEDYYELSGESARNTRWLTRVTPIAFEIEQSLLPKDTGPEWAFFKTYVPEMRRRLEAITGVRVSSVRVRGNATDMPAESYLIMLDEVPLVFNTVQDGMRYCPAAPERLKGLGIPVQDLIEATHPVTGETGCWVGREQWQAVIDHGLELWAEPLVFAIYHLEALLRSNLADYLGVDEVEESIARWQDDADGAALVQTALPDAKAKLRFGRVLRTLARERVPITAWKEILETVKQTGLASDDVNEVVRAVRLRLKRQLPGNKTSARRLELPPELEGKITPWVRRRHGRTFFAIPPEETQEALSHVRHLVGADTRNLVLVTESARLRPFFRRLVELEFPHLMVLSREELLEEPLRSSYDTVRGTPAHAPRPSVQGRANRTG